MNKILVLVVLLLLSTSVVSAEVDVNYFGEINKLTGHPDAVSFVDWSPDGTQIVSSDWTNGVKIWNMDEGTVFMNLTGHSDTVWTVKWNPDGTKIASASWDKTVRVWDSLTGEELAIYNHTQMIWGLDWSPDGKNIISGDEVGNLTLWNVSTSEIILSIPNPVNNRVAATIEWSPDGTKIAVGYWDSKVIILNASTYEIIGIYDYLPDFSADVEAMSWSPDSNWIAVGGDGSNRNSNLIIIDVINNTLLDFGNVHDFIWGVSWSPDGTKIATALHNANILIWDVNGNIIRTLTGHPSGDWAQAVDWSPDGTKLASGASDKTVLIWGDLRDVISEQDETIQGQQNTLNNISSDVTRFEQAMQTTFDDPDFALNGSTPDEKVNTLVDVLVQTTNSAMKEIYRLLGYK